MAIIKDGGRLVNESFEDLRKFARNKERIHYVGMVFPPRPGVSECITRLEYVHYKPGTDRNELFYLRILEWCNMSWIIVSIPIKEKEYMEKIADECGLRIANGVPTLISAERIRRFPIDNERIFTLENKSGHPVYKNDPKLNEELLQMEQAAMRVIRGEEVKQ